jgi:dihydroneopterin aldolase
MVTIHLHNIILFAYHGIYEEERVTGNTFEVNVDVVYDDEERNFEHIGHTINYEELYGIIKQEMQTATHLLEKVCLEIICAISQRYPFIKEASVSIYKLKAPIEGLDGKVGVTLSRKFNEL